MRNARALGGAWIAMAALALGFAAPAASRTPAKPAPTALPTREPSITVTSGALYPSDAPDPTTPAHGSASPTVGATQDPVAERDFERARAWWLARRDVPYVRYGALVRYEHNGHVFDNWWDAYYRSADGAMTLHRLVDVDEDRRRLRGVPFSIFGLKIFDTNPDSEPIRLDEPQIDPASSFGVVTRFGKPAVPRPTTTQAALPTPEASDDLREIGRIESTTRAYDVRLVGSEAVAGVPTLHLTLRALRDPKTNRVRDLWLDPKTYRTVQSRVAGILNGKPYDGIPWTIHYVQIDGRQYVQQIVADEPLHFGIDTTLPRFEFDFVDYRFPGDVPKYTFDRPF